MEPTTEIITEQILQELKHAYAGTYHSFRDLTAHLILKADFRTNKNLRQHVKKLNNELENLGELLGERR